MWGSGSVPQRPEWGFRTQMFLTPRTTCLGHGCPWQTGPQTFALKGVPIQHKTERSDGHHPSPCTTSTSPSSPHSAMEHPSGTTTSTSMVAELHEILSWAMLSSSGSVPGHTTLRRPTSAAPGTPPSIRAKDSLGLERTDSVMLEPIATSSQASLQGSAHDDNINATPLSWSPSLTPTSEAHKVVYVPTALQSEIPPGALSDEIFQLQREMNTAMGWLLTTWATLDAQFRMLVSDTKTTIKDTKTLCATTIWETEATCAAAIREQKEPAQIISIPCNSLLIRVYKSWNAKP